MLVKYCSYDFTSLISKPCHTLHNFNLSQFISDLSTTYICVPNLLLLASSYTVFTPLSYVFAYSLRSVKEETGSFINIQAVWLMLRTKSPSLLGKVSMKHGKWFYAT